MPTKKKVEKKEPEVKAIHINEIWNVIEEMQKNINHINDKISRISSRLGI
jgi:hypothetical protein|tara:strand:+ start:1430 stop:1579 length:150 start_codon:yes stop_codon:yes gene_type:complete